MSQVNNNPISRLMNSADLGPTQSIQLQFAKLQLALAEISKSGAMAHMEDIKNSQAEQEKIAKFLNEARELQSKATDSICSVMSPEMEKYMKDNGLAIDQTGNGDRYHLKKEWDVNIKSLQSHQEQLGTATQQKMVLIQDFMGQYNAYLQGANSSINQSNQVLQSIARGQ